MSGYEEDCSRQTHPIGRILPTAFMSFQMFISCKELYIIRIALIFRIFNSSLHVLAFKCASIFVVGFFLYWLICYAVKLYSGGKKQLAAVRIIISLAGSDRLLNIRHNHIVELLRPISVEVRHLEPIGLVLNADVIQLNENPGRFDIVATVPLKQRAQSGFDL